ncbi:MAG: hypothetical protein FWG38_09930 [Defluviitaleaceae bacterium]|jgi:hypothetical protein|nr:hypothetical protein [Defluviitaleaceae bacterium]
MRIKVRSEGHKFSIWLPSRLLFNPATAAICVKALHNKHYSVFKSQGLLAADEANPLTYSTMRKLFSAIRKSRRVLQGQPLVTVYSADGDVVEIWM